ncbi:MAG: hypothetical protein FD189_1493 [Elusimicrobia bacterium]|nr:MAG: hypothetical protein FD154_1710 [Elusimicrobiota bacterium]KAF0155160.1 MAG: hypothetical protein FD189_1493 [Elusimicrobiota bacterium]
MNKAFIKIFILLCAQTLSYASLPVSDAHHYSRPTKITHPHIFLNRPVEITQVFGGVTYTLRYVYDAAGNRVSREDRDGRTTYSYDLANRLIRADDPMAAETFAYDDNGNRLADKEAKDYAYDAANRIQANSLYTFAHDPNGNLTNWTNKSGNATITYDYNPEQRLSEVNTPDRSVSYKYDPLGRRIEKAVDDDWERSYFSQEDTIGLTGRHNLYAYAHN